jgi:uncharacterized membrane protein YgcG
MSGKSNSLKIIIFILLLWAYPVSLWAVTPPIPAHPAQYVVDLADVLNADARTRLNTILKDLEAQTTAHRGLLSPNCSKMGHRPEG